MFGANELDEENQALKAKIRKLEENNAYLELENSRLKDEIEELNQQLFELAGVS